MMRNAKKQGNKAGRTSSTGHGPDSQNPTVVAKTNSMIVPPAAHIMGRRGFKRSRIVGFFLILAISSGAFRFHKSGPFVQFELAGRQFLSLSKRSHNSSQYNIRDWRRFLRPLLGRPTGKARTRLPGSFSTLLRKLSLPSGRPRPVCERSCASVGGASTRVNSACHSAASTILRHFARSSKPVLSSPAVRVGARPPLHSSAAQGPLLTRVRL